MENEIIKSILLQAGRGNLTEHRMLMNVANLDSQTFLTNVGKNQGLRQLATFNAPLH